MNPAIDRTIAVNRLAFDDDSENVFLREEATYFDRKEKRKKTSSIWALSLVGCGKCFPAVILSGAKNLALRIFMNIRDSSFAMLRTASGSPQRQRLRVFPQPAGG
jgi:hypothetical protein